MTKPILLIEDSDEWGELIFHPLRRRGFRVDWFVRAYVERRRIKVVNNQGSLLDLYPENYSVALVNGNLGGKSAPGCELMPIFKEYRLKVIAISSAERANTQMLEAGAAESIPNWELWRKIMDDRFHLCEWPASIASHATT